MAVGHVEPAMRVDQHLDVGTDGFADQCGHLGALALALLRHLAVEVAVPLLTRTLVREGIELEGGVAGLNDRRNLVDDALLAGELALVGVGVELDAVAHRPAEELVDRQVEDLAADVPERDVDGADAFDAGAAAAHVGEVAEDLVPDPLDVRGVLARDHAADLLERGAERAVGEKGRAGDLTPAGDAFVGRHLDEEVFAPVGAGCLDQPRFYARNLHSFPHDGRLLAETALRSSEAHAFSGRAIPSLEGSG